jgi:hypothetical protein
MRRMKMNTNAYELMGNTLSPEIKEAVTELIKSRCPEEFCINERYSDEHIKDVPANVPVMECTKCFAKILSQKEAERFYVCVEEVGGKFRFWKYPYHSLEEAMYQTNFRFYSNRYWAIYDEFGRIYHVNDKRKGSVQVDSLADNNE